jgi:hypothetical protein
VPTRVGLIAGDEGWRRLRTEDESSVTSQAVEISYDDWVFPKGGMASVWVLDSEMSTGPTAAQAAAD